MKFSLLKSKWVALPALCLTFCVTLASAADEVLVEGGGVAVRGSDIAADSQRIPPEARKQALGRPDGVAQMATNLFHRRLLASEAQQKGLAADPVVAAALQIARDRVLSDALLTRIDAANTPDAAALDAYASSTYKAESKRFSAPEEVRARHILVAADTKDARAKAQQLLGELRAGANFEKLARDNSADASNAAKGGDLGFFTRGRMVEPFEQAVFSMQVGQLSDVVETKFGFHIIKLEEKRPAGMRPFEEVRDELRKEASTKAVRAGREQLGQRLNAAVKLNEPAIQAIAQEQR